MISGNSEFALTKSAETEKTGSEYCTFLCVMNANGISVGNLLMLLLQRKHPDKESAGTPNTQRSNTQNTRCLIKQRIGIHRPL